MSYVSQRSLLSQVSQRSKVSQMSETFEIKLLIGTPFLDSFQLYFETPETVETPETSETPQIPKTKTVCWIILNK